MRAVGRISAVRGTLVEAALPFARVGGVARIGGVAARVVALRGDAALLAPFAAVSGVACGDRVVNDPRAGALPLGTPLLGRAVAPDGTPLDARGGVRGRLRPVDVSVATVDERSAVHEPCWTGVRAIDGPLAFGRGARIGVFGAPGAGKSTLLESIARHAACDASVVALVGERGREAERWIAACDARTTIVCATSDRSAAERVRAAEAAFAQADALRRRGLHVVLVLDSLARVCAAQRELGVAAGEPPGRGGYPPSAFALAARLLECAGSFRRGSITLIATVLSDGPPEGDPLADAARSLLDGHVVLSERLARGGRFPAIDIPRSASRTFGTVATPAHADAAQRLRQALAALDTSADARALGLPPPDALAARAVAAEPAIEGFLRQGRAPAHPDETLTRLVSLADTL